MKYKNKIMIFLITTISFIPLGCPYYYSCSDQNYYCRHMFSTIPFEKPLKYDHFTNSILYADGNIVYNNNETGILDVFSLRDICSSDTICDIEFYDRYIRFRNYSDYFENEETISDSFKVVLSSNRCFILDCNYNILRDFGYNGPDSIILINAVDVDINFEKQIYIIDKGDNSVKIFDSYGNFISKLSNIGALDKFKIYDRNIFILNKLDDSIRQYEFDGEFIRTITDGYQFDEITAFTPLSDNGFWVADLGGSRLTLNSGGSHIVEFDGGYCYMDIIFNFGLIYWLEGDIGLEVIDINNNSIISIGKE